jgi:L-rhamnose mutarotase
MTEEVRTRKNIRRFLWHGEKIRNYSLEINTEFEERLFIKWINDKSSYKGKIQANSQKKKKEGVMIRIMEGRDLKKD